jgi:hypothetical protein
MKGTPVSQVETKVKAGTAAAAVSGLALFALGRYVFKGDVPDVVASWTYAIIPAAITFAAGYRARHTARGAVTDEQIAAAVRKYAGDLTAPAPAAVPPAGTQM